MKITLELDVEKVNGPTVAAEDVAEALAVELDDFDFEAQHPEADHESVYVVRGAQVTS